MALLVKRCTSGKVDGRPKLMLLPNWETVFSACVLVTPVILFTNDETDTFGR